MNTSKEANVLPYSTSTKSRGCTIHSPLVVSNQWHLNKWMSINSSSEHTLPLTQTPLWDVYQSTSKMVIQKL